jgi:putative tryptophan/tyrosine transport system substrate-binding protein
MDRRRTLHGHRALDRRAFVSGLTLGVLAARRPLEAQPAAKAVRIGVLRPAPDDPVFRHNFHPFRQMLREKGFLEGSNLTIEYRVRAGSPEEILALAGELVRLNVDAILAISPAGVNAAARATTSIPIVAVDLETDPKAAGFAASLARPGGNITGLFLDFPELGGKWIELLKEVVPRLGRVAVLWDPATGPSLLKGAEVAAQALKVQPLPLEARGPDDFAGVFRSAATERAGAMLVLSSPVFNSARKRIAELAAKHHIPALMPFTGFAEDGGLMAYGPHVTYMFRQAGGVMAKVLKGTRPGDLPIERPARFELVVNLRTAKALGLTIPPSVLVRADQVIE